MAETIEHYTHYTVNTEGNNVKVAEESGYHAYYANGITAVEVRAKSKRQARSIVSQFAKVLYIFE